jgi:hypothetical protein
MLSCANNDKNICCQKQQLVDNDIYWSHIIRVSTEINFVGISIGIPIEINFDFRTKLKVEIIEINRNSTKFRLISFKNKF